MLPHAFAEELLLGAEWDLVPLACIVLPDGDAVNGVIEIYVFGVMGVNGAFRASHRHLTRVSPGLRGPFLAVPDIAVRRASSYSR